MLHSVSSAELSEILFARLRTEARSQPLFVQSDKATLSEVFNIMADSTDRVVQSASTALDEDGLTVGFMKAKDLSMAVMSAQVPNAAGSPVGVLLSQDNLAVLRRMARYYPSVLVVEFSGEESAPDANILAQFLSLKKIKDIDLGDVVLVLTGDVRALPRSLINQMEAFELKAQTLNIRSSPSIR